VVPAQQTRPAALAAARQMILVTTADWSSVTGQLSRFSRAKVTEPWAAVGDEIPIVVGRSGLAWGRGVHGNPPDTGPVKHEGDGKAPAGIFRLSSAFGYAARDAVSFIKMPYTQATSTIECVDDADSTRYNRLVDRSQSRTIDWKSSEQMLRPDDLYRLGVVVEHNANTPLPGGGSCIFLHIWSGPSNGTSGCTAMDASRIEELLAWLDPDESPILVQLTKPLYLKLSESWGLPGAK
jgi:L,D-peptidoglycan transpeptidase YkuD (ErfK/YbiS/YcfS/YnhG family)